jgi:hypothetical protein
MQGAGLLKATSTGYLTISIAKINLKLLLHHEMYLEQGGQIVVLEIRVEHTAGLYTCRTSGLLFEGHCYFPGVFLHASQGSLSHPTTQMDKRRVVGAQDARGLVESTVRFWRN